MLGFFSCFHLNGQTLNFTLRYVNDPRSTSVLSTRDEYLGNDRYPRLQAHRLDGYDGSYILLEFLHCSRGWLLPHGEAACALDPEIAWAPRRAYASEDHDVVKH